MGGPPDRGWTHVSREGLLSLGFGGGGGVAEGVDLISNEGMGFSK